MVISNIIHASLLGDPLGQNQKINHKYEYEYKINTCHGCTKTSLACCCYRRLLKAWLKNTVHRHDSQG